MTGWTGVAHLLTREEVAELLREDSPRTVDRLRTHQGLPAVWIGRHWRYRREDVAAWLADRVVRAS